MSNLKYYNDSTGQWEYLVIGKQGPTGPTGATGATGNDGALSPNYIINGAFDIWQRGTSFSTPANNSYTVDRWATNNLGSVARSTDTPDGFEYSALITDNGFQFSNLFTRIESAESTLLVGQQVTVSAWVKVNQAVIDANEFTMSLLYPTTKDNFGTLTSWASSSGLADDLVAGSWVRVSFSFSSPLPSNFENGLQLRIFLNLTTTANLEAYITGVQLEAGSVATPFKRHAPSLQGELAACQRYYYRNSPGLDFSNFGMGYTATTTQAKINVPMPTKMRTDRPNSVEYGGNLRLIQIGGFNQPVASVTQDTWSNSGFLSLNVNTSGSFTQGETLHFTADNDASAFVAFEDEL